jgi:glutamine---fructose-6-phosphate transaminase (isomerizing)
MNDSIMLKNICEQPKVVADCLAIELPLPDSFLSAQRIMILACGSSRHAGLVGEHWFETIAKIPVQVLDAAAWTDRSPLVESNTLIIALSQSGKTKNLLEALTQIKAVTPEIQVLAIGNGADSPLVDLADSAIVTPATPEGAVAATKSFSAQLVILARIAVNLAEYKSLVSTSIELTSRCYCQIP